MQDPPHLYLNSLTVLSAFLFSAYVFVYQVRVRSPRLDMLRDATCIAECQCYSARIDDWVSPSPPLLPPPLPLFTERLRGCFASSCALVATCAQSTLRLVYMASDGE